MVEIEEKIKSLKVRLAREQQDLNEAEAEEVDQSDSSLHCSYVRDLEKKIAALTKQIKQLEQTKIFEFMVTPSCPVVVTTVKDKIKNITWTDGGRIKKTEYEEIKKQIEERLNKQ